jgi:hypothetical protein
MTPQQRPLVLKDTIDASIYLGIHFRTADVQAVVLGKAGRPLGELARVSAGRLIVKTERRSERRSPAADRVTGGDARPAVRLRGFGPRNPITLL